ncbi:MAG: DsrE family protein [Pseudomonadota bacterium]
MNSGQNTPLIVVAHAPYEGTLARSAIDAALSFAVFGQQPNLLFVGNGAWCLRASQSPDGIGKKSLRKVIDSLPLYDIEAVYVDESAFGSPDATAQDLPSFARVLNRDGLMALRQGASCVLSF